MTPDVSTHELVDEDGRSAGLLRAVDSDVITYLATHRREAQRRAAIKMNLAETSIISNQGEDDDEENNRNDEANIDA